MRGLALGGKDRGTGTRLRAGVLRACLRSPDSCTRPDRSPAIIVRPPRATAQLDMAPSPAKAAISSPLSKRIRIRGLTLAGRIGLTNPVFLKTDQRLLADGRGVRPCQRQVGISIPGPELHRLRKPACMTSSLRWPFWNRTRSMSRSSANCRIDFTKLSVI
jgi:hypothetical protein